MLLAYKLTAASSRGTLSGKRNVGKILTVLVLFLLTVVVVLVIFSYFTGLIVFTGGATHNAKVEGVFALDPNNDSAGTLIMSVTNLSSSPITAIGFSCPTSDFASAACTGLTLTNSGGPISAQNPVDKNSGAGGSALLALAPGANLPAGASSVTVTVVVTFADGTIATFPIGLPTQE